MLAARGMLVLLSSGAGALTACWVSMPWSGATTTPTSSSFSSRGEIMGEILRMDCSCLSRACCVTSRGVSMPVRWRGVEVREDASLEEDSSRGVVGVWRPVLRPALFFWPHKQQRLSRKKEGGEGKKLEGGDEGQNRARVQ